ncbi:hypothetical protein IIA15_04625 [candidate division TA06 bacterium]|nr:hypothetical protein [candidate division TA06 bacterium]
MSRSGLLIAFLFLFPTSLLTEELIATLPDGRKALLKEDGTWTFVQGASNEDPNSPEMGPLPSISFLKVERKLIPKNPKVKGSMDRVQLALHLHNNTEERIKKWKATMTVKDPFGEQLFQVRLTGGSSPIGPRKTKKVSFEWKDDPEEKREPYDYLMIYNPDVLKIELSEIEIEK